MTQQDTTAPATGPVRHAPKTMAVVRTDLPADLGVYLPYSDRRTFRPDRMDETLMDGRYSVAVAGPIRTKIGGDHSTHRGFETFDGMADLPAELAAIVVGPDGLLALLHGVTIVTD